MLVNDIDNISRLEKKKNVRNEMIIVTITVIIPATSFSIVSTSADANVVVSASSCAVYKSNVN